MQTIRSVADLLWLELDGMAIKLAIYRKINCTI